MFHELENVQKVNDKPRRWFEDDYFDLIVWYEPDGSIYGIQLCYDRKGNEHSFTWEKGKGFFHNRIDSGESDLGISKQTPILVADGVFPYDKISKTFNEHAKGLDKNIAKFVKDKLAEYSKKHA